jgi:L-ascorbate metabolism protein UlaG (beta-lactamase superfamily)
MKKRGGCRQVIVLLLLAIVALVIILIRSTEWLAALGGRVSGRRAERVRQSPQFSNGKFRNAEQTRMATASFREMARRQFLGGEQREPSAPIPVVRRTTDDYKTPPASGLRATWIGWSSVLVEIDGHTVLTDPVWSERCSPSTLVGPRRFHAPPIELAALPPIEVVVISHDHYDHLDMPVIRALAAKGTRFAVPLGIGAHLERWNVPAAQIRELDWNQSLEINGLSITATPARHYSGRNPMYANETLWASWVIKGPQHRVFFSGDTGYTAAFRAIGESHGPFDLTIIKVGASDPTWSEIHMTPEEAVATHRDVRGRVMLPVHWATFNLAFHAWREPADRAVAETAKSGVTIVVPRPGDFVEPGAVSMPPEVWW